MAILGVSIAFNNNAMTASPTWTRIDVGAVTEWWIDRGRRDEFERTGTGTAGFRLIDKTGDFDPTNSHGPYYGKLDPGLQAAIALQNPNTAAWFTMFRGHISDINVEVDITEGWNVVTFSLVDGMAFLSTVEMTVGDFGGTDDPPTNGLVPVGSDGDIYFSSSGGTATTGVQTRINAVLNDAGWPSGLRDIFTGNVGIQETVYSRRDQVISVIHDAADAEFPDIANFYMSKGGSATFHGRYARFNPTDATYGISTWKVGDQRAFAIDSNTVVVTALEFNRGDEKILNSVLALPAGVSEDDVPGQLYENATSITKYGLRSASFENLLTNNGTILNGGGVTTAVEETELFEEYFVNNLSFPVNRINKIEVKSQEPAGTYGSRVWTFLTQVEISDRLAVTTTHVGTAAAGGGGFGTAALGTALGTAYHYVEGLHYRARPLNQDYHDITLQMDTSPGTAYFHNPFTL